MPKFTNANWPTIWGFDLSELSFSAFSSKKMFDRKWHLRRERFVAYQAAMLICLAAECTATYSKYEDLQDHIEDRYAPAHLYNNDIIDFQIVIIVFCVFVATLFGADFFFLLQFPKRRYPDWYQNTKKFFAIVITVGVFVGALGSTIVVARNSAQIVHVSDQVAREAAAYYFRPPLQYNRWAVNIAYVVLIWIGFVACVVSTWFMFLAASFDKMHPAAFVDSSSTALPISSSSHPSTERVHATTSDPMSSASARPSGHSSFDLGPRDTRPYAASSGLDGSEGEKLATPATPTPTPTTTGQVPLRSLDRDAGLNSHPTV
ncbi:hypothetical protein JCM11491_002477 [Sporobolomyces phaffii]